MDDLRETAVLPHLQTKWLGQYYRYFAEIGSTNDALKNEVAQLPSGSLFLTDFQSKGRGRLNRVWQAPPQTCLLMSLLLKLDWAVEQGQWVTMMVSLAVAEAIEAATDLRVGLKWPNDVLIDIAGVWHKCCGILLEGTVGENGRFSHIILGMGLNVNIPAEQLPEAVTPATSLLAATGEIVPRLPLLLDILARLESWLNVAQSPYKQWQERLVILGEEVTVSGNGRSPIKGIAEGVNSWGHLLVRQVDGVLAPIAAGDVTLRDHS